MNFKQILYSTVAMIGFAALSGVFLALVSAAANAQQAAVAIDNDDIGGVVRGPAGPEAGVWVIAETTELPTKFAGGGAVHSINSSFVHVFGTESAPRK